MHPETSLTVEVDGPTSAVIKDLGPVPERRKFYASSSPLTIGPRRNESVSSGNSRIPQSPGALHVRPRKVENRQSHATPASRKLIGAVVYTSASGSSDTVTSMWSEGLEAK